MRLPPGVCTHFLYIPVGTRASSARVNDALSEIINDPLAGALPRAAWVNGRELRYSIEPLRLQDKAQVDKAEHLLRSPEVRRILEETQIATPISPSSIATPKSVTLRGLNFRPSYEPDRVSQFDAFIQDSPFDLQRLRDRLRQCFVGLSAFPNKYPDQIPASWKPRARIMQTTYLTTNELGKYPNVAKYGYGSKAGRKPLVDARDLYTKYKDHLWAKDIDVQKLCISEAGLQDITRNGSVVGQGYREVASVGLPGLSDEMVEPEDPEERYIKAAKTRHRNQPVTPLWISLRPQSEAPDLSPRSASRLGKA